MQRIFPSIPNIAFHRIVKQYAFETGKPVFTLVNLDTAFIHYLAFAAKYN